MKNFIKILSTLVIVCLIVSCSQRYNEHFYGERNIEWKDFVGSGDFVSGGEIIDFPNAKGMYFLLQAIKNAKEKIWIEIYSWTKLNDLYDALLEAKNRGVDIRVILEWNVYGSPTINVTTKNFLEKNNIPIRYANNNKFTFTHAKFWIIDNDYYISTGNWTKSFFSKNREYIYHDRDVFTRQFLEKIFALDFDWKSFSQKSDIPDHIVMSPLNAREKIQNFINTTQTEIWVYVQTVSDADIIQNLQNLIKSGKTVHICTADNENNRDEKEKFTGNWRIASNPYLHAKIMLRDSGELFLWSENFTTNSLDNNREMWILLKNRTDLVEKIKKQIITHCQF